MKYRRLKEFNNEEFYYLTGVKGSTFEKMIDILRDNKPYKVNLIL